MCLLRCSAGFGPHSFAHSCPVDPASARPSSNKIILHNLPRACGLTRNMNAYVITSSFFVVFSTFWESSWLWSFLTEVSEDPAAHWAAPKILYISDQQHLKYPNILRTGCKPWLHFQFTTVWSQFDIWNTRNCEEAFLPFVSLKERFPSGRGNPAAKKAEWWLRVCLKGQPRTSEELLLLEGQPECGIKALISSHSLCVCYFNKYSSLTHWGSFMTEWRAQKPF